MPRLQCAHLTRRAYVIVFVVRRHPTQVPGPQVNAVSAAASAAVARNMSLKLVELAKARQAAQTDSPGPCSSSERTMSSGVTREA